MTQVIIDIDGYFLDQTSLNLFSTSLGTGALSQNTGQYNTATGFKSLSFLSGSFNTGNGAFALNLNTTGRENTGIVRTPPSVPGYGVQYGRLSEYGCGSNVLNVACSSQNSDVGDNPLGSVTKAAAMWALVIFAALT